VKLLDLFSGIGGFHLGLEQSGFEFDWIGYSEIDKYASKQYKRRFPNATELGDVTTIQPKDLPTDITILCGGFPCQAFSIAGKRQGFNDTRGTLFFEIARILRYFKENGKPIPYFVLENVKGLLSHDDGQTFATIYGVLTQLDYTIECQILNTKWFLPQNRERIYIVGHLGERGRSKIFPVTENDIRNRKKYIQKIWKSSKEKQDMQYFMRRRRCSKYRRLTPVECERLQGFPDGWTKGQSDTQRYKQLGNAVSVPVVKAVGDKIWRLTQKNI